MFVFFHHILQLSTLNGYLRVMFASLRLVFAIELVSTRKSIFLTQMLGHIFLATRAKFKFCQDIAKIRK